MTHQFMLKKENFTFVVKAKVHQKDAVFNKIKCVNAFTGYTTKVFEG